MSAVSEGRELICELTTRSITFLCVIHTLCRNDEPRTPSDIARVFRDCSHQRASGEMYRLVGLGAARWDNIGGSPTCRPTEAGVEAMRIYFRDWRTRFSEADDRKVIDG